MKGTVFRGEATMRRGCGDTLLKAKQLIRNRDVGEENSSPIKNTEVLKRDCNRRRAHFSQPCDEAGVLLRRRIPKKLQSNMPRFRRSPAKAVLVRPEALRNLREVFDDPFGQRDCNKETHSDEEGPVVSDSNVF
jgi:hypothetical protein